jgi:hypothetical protein
MAGRHGVPSKERRTHARVARRQRRRRLQRRDAAQPWLLWLLFRIVLALVVVGAGTWSVLLVRRGQGGYWPVIAVAAGLLSLILIGLDVAARRRQRAALRVPSVARLIDPAQPMPSVAGPVPEYRGAHHFDGESTPGSVPRPSASLERLPPLETESKPDRPGRHAHRR